MAIEIPPLEELLKRAEEHWQANGYSKKIREERRERLAKEYQTREAVLADVAEGLSQRAIARKQGISASMVPKWKQGTLPPLMRGVLYGHIEKILFTIPSVGNDGLSRLLGLCLAHTDTGTGYKRSLVVGRDDPNNPDLEYVTNAITDVMGPVVYNHETERDLESIFRVGFQSRSFFAWFKEVTKDYSHIPQHFLESESSKIAFLEGYSFQSMRSAPAILKDDTRVNALYFNKQNASLMHDLTMLVADIGLLPRCSRESDRKVLAITDADDVNLLINKNIVPKRLLPAAQKIVQSRRGGRKNMEVYQEIQKLKKRQFSEDDVLLLFKDEFLPGLLKSWYHNKGIPFAARRQKDLRSLKRSLKNQYKSTPSKIITPTSSNNVEIELDGSSEWYAHEDIGLPKHLAKKVGKRKLDSLQRLHTLVTLAQINFDEYHHFFTSSDELAFSELDKRFRQTVPVNGTTYEITNRALAGYFKMFDVDDPASQPMSYFRQCWEHIGSFLPDNPSKNMYHEGNGLIINFSQDYSGKYTVIEGINFSNKVDRDSKT